MGDSLSCATKHYQVTTACIKDPLYLEDTMLSTDKAHGHFSRIHIYALNSDRARARTNTQSAGLTHDIHTTMTNSAAILGTFLGLFVFGNIIGLTIYGVYEIRKERRAAGPVLPTTTESATTRSEIEMQPMRRSSSAKPVVRLKDPPQSRRNPSIQASLRGSERTVRTLASDQVSHGASESLQAPQAARLANHGKSGYISGVRI